MCVISYIVDLIQERHESSKYFMVHRFGTNAINTFSLEN